MIFKVIIALINCFVKKNFTDVDMGHEFAYTKTTKGAKSEMERLRECRICPRECGVNREENAGFCGAGGEIRAARAALHFWEEPCISGKRGSGTIFFSGCNLGCVYCQNEKISLDNFGTEISIERLSDIFLELYDKGAHNINLVTPTPYALHIIKAIDKVKDRVKIPFIYNTGGYERQETLRALDGYIDIFLTDVKYYSSELSKRYSGAKDYFEIAVAAAEEMIKMVGKPEFDDENMLKRGVIIRHLVLPSHRKDSIEVLRELTKRISHGDFVLSLMSQYTPTGKLEEFLELRRKVTTFEYDSVVGEAIRLGITNGYMQDRRGASEKFIPIFNLEGIVQENK